MRASKRILEAIFVIMLVAMVHSFSTILDTGPAGLIGFIEWLISSSYVTLWLYGNREYLVDCKEKE